jgi:hypothetical protein
MAIDLFDAWRLQPDILDVADDADGDDAMAVSVAGAILPSLFLDRRRNAVRSRSSGPSVAPVMIVMPCFSSAFSSEGRDFGVLDRHTRSIISTTVTSAPNAVEAGELDADGARADHQQATRHSGGDHGVAVGPDALAIGFQPANGNRAPAHRWRG